MTASHDPTCPRCGRRHGGPSCPARGGELIDEPLAGPPRLSGEQSAALKTLARVAGPQEAVLVVAMLELGLRTPEILAADIEDLSRQGSFTALAVRGKGRAAKDRRIPLSGALVDLITSSLGDRRSGPLLVAGTGRRMTRQQAGEIIRRLGEQLGIEALDPADLRHDFVARAQESLSRADAVGELDAPTALRAPPAEASLRRA